MQRWKVYKDQAFFQITLDYYMDITVALKDYQKEHQILFNHDPVTFQQAIIATREMFMEVVRDILAH